MKIFLKTDSILCQLLSNAELEQKMKSFEDLHIEYGSAKGVLNLRDMFRLITVAEEEKAQLRELEVY